MSWPVFVINMADNTTRMARAADELNRLNIDFTRFEAVNGRQLSEAEVAVAYDPDANLRRARHPLVMPEIGCYLSHIALWRQIAEGDAPAGVILEDDFVAQDDLADVLKALEADTAQWDIFKLFSARVGQKVTDTWPLSDGRSLARPYKVPNTMLGYVVRRESAAHLVASALPFSRPVDEDHKHFWELDLDVAMVTPPPLAFGFQGGGTGTITAARRHKPKWYARGALSQNLRSLRFRINYTVKLHWHRTLQRIAGQ